MGRLAEADDADLLEDGVERHELVDVGGRVGRPGPDRVGSNAVHQSVMRAVHQFGVRVVSIVTSGHG
ncbi:MAG: hypothetical protein ACOCSN_06710, partial [Halanaeroarchaeum sp.]